MRISSLSKIGVIKEFHAYCVSRGTDKIQHTDERGHANWNVCAVGQFTKHNKIRLDPDKVYNKYIGPALTHYQPKDGLFETITYRLNRSTEASKHYPTYAKLAKALAGCIK